MTRSFVGTMMTLMLASVSAMGGCGLVTLQTNVNGKQKTYGGSSDAPKQKETQQRQAQTSPPSKEAPAQEEAPSAEGSPATARKQPPAGRSGKQNLPTVSQVKAKVQGKAQREAAYEVMVEYLAFTRQYGVAYEAMPVQQQHAIERRISAFEAAQKKIQSPEVSYGLSEAARKFYDDPAFQLATIQNVVSPAAAAQFQNSSFFQETAVRAQTTSMTQAADRVVKAAAADKKPGVDRSVFGIQLGEVLSLPRCSNEMDDTALVAGLLGGSKGIAETCWGDASGTIALGVTQMAAQAAGMTSTQSRIQQVAVRLADTACPDWARVPGRCTVFVSVLDGVALGATITVTPFSEGGSKTVVNQLTAKYKMSPTNGGTVTSCVNVWSGVELAQAYERSWSPDGLFVRYDPLGFGNCRQGIIQVELSYLQKVRAEEEAARQASAPKM